MMLDKMNEINPDIDVLLVSGDYVSHGYSVDYGSAQDQYIVLKQTIEHVFLNILAKKFPKAIILPTIGNNDIKYHYVAPQRNVSAPDYYPFLKSLIFQRIPSNMKFYSANVSDTFDVFGGYRVDYSPTLSFLSFNSLYYNVKLPSNDTEIKRRQMDWLADQLDHAEPGRKFVIFFHIYPGMFFIGRITFFWEKSAVIWFNEIVQRNIDKIALMTGAHTHFPDLKLGFPTEFSLPHLMNMNETALEYIPSYVLLITPSISPIFRNNPGFTFLTMEDQVAKNITWYYFELNRLPRDESEVVFNKIDFNTYMNITEFTPGSVLNFIKELMHDKVRLYRYLAHKIGYRGAHMITAISRYQEMNMVNLASEYEYFCSLLNMMRADYYFCVESSKQKLDLVPV